MALPTVVFNSGTGSDTAASGAGPATALSGANGVTVAATNTVTLATDAPDLSGVATDGSAVMWVDSSSGRQYSKITAVDNTTKVVTCQSTFANSETKAWGIGGKRATFDHADSRTLFSSTGAFGGWIIETETGQSLTSALPVVGVVSAADGPLTIRGAASVDHPTVTQTANTQAFDCNGTATNLRFQNLTVVNSNGTKTAASGIRCTSHAFSVTVQDCILGHATNTLLYGFERAASWGEKITFIDCEIKNCTSHGIGGAGSLHVIKCIGCWIHDNVGSGIGSADADLSVNACLIETNGADGILVSSLLRQLTNSVIHGNTGDGVDFSSSGPQVLNAIIVNNNITANGNYGIRGHANSMANLSIADFNNFGTGATANTSGARLSITAGANDLAVDPGYADAANANYEAGTAIKALGFPKSTRTIGANQSLTNAFVDIGIQREEASVRSRYLLGI